MPTPEKLLLGVLVPALLAGLTLLVGGKLWRARVEVAPRRSAALAIGVAFIASFIAVSGIAPLPEEGRVWSGLDRAFWGSLFVTALALVEGGLGPHRWLARGVLRSLAGGALLTVIAHASGVGGLELGVLFIGWLALVVAGERVQERESGVAGALSLWLVVSGFAGVSILTGSARLAELAGGLGAGLGAVAVLSAWRPRARLAGGGVSVVTFGVASLGLNAYHFSYAGSADLLLLCAGIVAPLALPSPPPGSRGGWRRLAWVLLLTALPVAVALTRAWLAYEPDPYAGYPAD